MQCGLTRFALPGRVPDVYGVSARFEIPEFAAIRTHHVSTYIKMQIHKHSYQDADAQAQRADGVGFAGPTTLSCTIRLTDSNSDDRR
jgi:hypothetical protein